MTPEQFRAIRQQLGITQAQLDALRGKLFDLR
jgi:predicted transcriptional regulator